MLSEYDNFKAKKIKLHLSEKILDFYNDWYDDFKKNRKLNFIQNLYKIFILLLYEKTNTIFLSKIQQFMI